MNRRVRSYREARLQRLANPVVAEEYLNLAKQESVESFVKALGHVAQARQMTRVARDAGVQRETLYRALSEQGNPTAQTLFSVLKAVGLEFQITVAREHGRSSIPKQVNNNMLMYAEASHVQRILGDVSVSGLLKHNQILEEPCVAGSIVPNRARPGELIPRRRRENTYGRIDSFAPIG